PPSTISPEQTSTTPSPAYAIADKTLILVTSDSSLYANVEITGATTAAFIREKIFTALNIFDDEDQSRFSIYRTEIGQYAIGDALTDDRLYEICRASGDSKGSLKLLVSHTSATVHDPNYRPPIQPAHSITPPVLPQYVPATNTQPQAPLPLQPSRRSRSRHGSVSSTSEHAGYDADLDNADSDNSHRNTIRPPPHQTSFSCVQGPSAPLPPSPLANRHPSTPQQSRPSSPPAPLSNTLQLDLNREQRDRYTIIDRYGRTLNIPPAPRYPPPAPPTGGTEVHGRRSTSRPLGQAVPARSPASWKGEQKMKFAESMDNLRLAASPNAGTINHPVTLLPGGLSAERAGKDWLTKFFESSGGSGTVIPPPRSNAHLKPPLPPIPVAPPPPPSSSSSSGTMISMWSTRSMQSDEFSDSDDDGAWNKRPATRPPLTVRIDSSPSSSPKSHPLPIPNANLSSTRDDPVPPPAGTPTPQRRPSATRRDKEARKRLRGSTFTAAEDARWATRPPPEDMYERLEEFFPEHDLDRPVIEAGSGGTSPTAVELPPVPVPPIPEPSSGVKARVKGKKSIRYVAQEHKKRIDRTSRALVAEGGGTDSESYAASMLRKRSTKLWGSKLEEVTPAQAKASPSHPEASPGGPTTFKW
ncbi:mitogen-activated protein kinase kinase kinase, partial [Marasmius crinis-equi]